MTRDEFLKLDDKETYYSDWFGEGCLKKDLIEQEHDAQAEWVKLDGKMALAKIGDDFVVFGYDGNEYYHDWQF